MRPGYDDKTLDELAALAEGGDAQAADVLRDALHDLAIAIDKRLGREVGAYRITKTGEWRMLSARLHQRDPILQYMADGLRHKSALKVIREIQARIAETPPRGRPVGSGTYRDRADFVNAMRGEYPSQSRVSAYLLHHGQGDATARCEMNKIELTLHATADGFATWLTRHTALLHLRDFPTMEGRRLCVQRASISYTTGIYRIEFRTSYHFVKNGEEWAYPPPPAISGYILPLASERLRVGLECSQQAVLPYFAELLWALSRVFPEAKQEIAEWLAAHGFEAPVSECKLGLHGGTLDRVREAHGLIQSGERKTRACKRVGIDPRTYDRYVDQVIDWEAEDPD